MCKIEKNSRLDGYFVSVTNSETAGVKSQIHLFLSMRYESQMQIEQSVMIGDSLDADGALQIGLELFSLMKIG
jgi:FMN phosphatase YigB (HAD superfamily)